MLPTLALLVFQAAPGVQPSTNEARDKERGKALMHCGAEGQGSHYLLYDYATAARALAALPAEDRRPFRERLRALLVATRCADGAFLDTPVLGAASGTALALAAFAALDSAR